MHVAFCPKVNMVLNVHRNHTDYQGRGFVLINSVLFSLIIYVCLLVTFIRFPVQKSPPQNIWEDPNTRRFKRMLISYDTDTQCSNVRGNPLLQATERHLTLKRLKTRKTTREKTYLLPGKTTHEDEERQTDRQRQRDTERQRVRQRQWDRGRQTQRASFDLRSHSHVHETHLKPNCPQTGILSKTEIERG